MTSKLDWILNQAARHGYTYLALQGTDYDSLAEHAARGGYSQLMVDLINLGGRDYDELAIQATIGGYYRLVELLQTYDSDIDRDELVYQATEYGRDSLRLKLTDPRTIDPASLAYFAAYGGHGLTVNRLAHDLDDYNDIAGIAAKQGYRWIVIDLLRSHPPINLDIVGIYAGRAGRRQIINELVRRGKVDPNLIALAATEGGHLDLVLWMIDLGADNYYQLSRAALHRNHLGIYRAIKFISEKYLN